MNNDKKTNDRKLEGNALTHEQLSDVYAAGTSDGIHQLAGSKIKITKEYFDDLKK